MKKKSFLLDIFQLDSLFICIYFLIISLTIYYFRSVFYHGGIYIILIALLPTLSFTNDDLLIRKHFINRNASQIKSDNAHFKKNKTKDWRIKGGYNQKNKYIFLFNRFLKNFISSTFIICTIISLVLLIMMGFSYLVDFINQIELPLIGTLSILKIIGLIFLASIISSIFFIIKERINRKKRKK